MDTTELEATMNELGSHYVKRPVTIMAFRAPVVIEIKTLEGTMRAERGDWIIKGVAGEFYPCKPEIFSQTYETVPESQ